MSQILVHAILSEPLGSYVQGNEYKCPFIKYEKNKYAVPAVSSDSKEGIRGDSIYHLNTLVKYYMNYKVSGENVA